MRLTTLLALACAHAVTACDGGGECSTRSDYSSVRGSLTVAGKAPVNMQSIFYEQGLVKIYDGHETTLEFFHDTTGNYPLAARQGRVCHYVDDSRGYERICDPVNGALTIHVDDSDDEATKFDGTVSLENGDVLTFIYDVIETPRECDSGCGSWGMPMQ